MRRVWRYARLGRGRDERDQGEEREIEREREQSRPAVGSEAGLCSRRMDIDSSPQSDGGDARRSVGGRRLRHGRSHLPRDGALRARLQERYAHSVVAQARVPPAEQQEVAKVHVGASGNACHEYPQLDHVNRMVSSRKRAFAGAA